MDERTGKGVGGAGARTLAEVGLEVTDRTNRWVFSRRRQFEEIELARWPDTEYLSSDADANVMPGRGAMFDDAGGGVPKSFWWTLQPLYDHLFARHRVAWCSTVLMFRARGLLHPDFLPSREVLAHEGWTVNQLIPELYEEDRFHKRPFETIIAADLCVNKLDDNLPLVITRGDVGEAAGAGAAGRVVSVGGFDRVVGDSLAELQEQFIEAERVRRERALADDFSRRELAPFFREADGILCDLLKGHDPGDLFKIPWGDSAGGGGILREELQRGYVPWLALSKYIVMMTVVWPGWERIIMLPHRGPVVSNAQPGGLVICEGGRGQAGDDARPGLSGEELIAVANIVSTAMWPWQAIESSEARGRREAAITNAAHLAEVLYHEYHNTYRLAGIGLRALKRKKKITESEFDGIYPYLAYTSYALRGLRGIAESPDDPTKIPVKQILDALTAELNKIKKDTVELRNESGDGPRVPRICYLIFSELIRNAHSRVTERREDAGKVSVDVSREAGRLVVLISNAATREEYRKVNRKMASPAARGASFLSQHDAKSGLVICKQLLDRFGGALRAEFDEPRALLTIRVEIPVGGEPQDA